MFSKPKFVTHKPWGKDRDSGRLQVTLCDRSEEISIQLAKHFGDFDNTRVLEGDINLVDSDAIVAPGNSFGDMSGGLDRDINLASNGRVERLVQENIRSDYLGELPVGLAIIVNTQDINIVYAPTMRVPGMLKTSINPYLAFRASLVAIHRHNIRSAKPIESLKVAGLGSGVGGIAAIECAEQMSVAYQNVAEGAWTSVVHPSLAPYATRS